MTAENPTKAELVQEFGLAIFGPEWGAGMGRLCGINPRTMTRIKTAAALGKDYAAAAGVLAALSEALDGLAVRARPFGRSTPPESEQVAKLEAELARLRAILNEDGLCDPELAAIGGRRMSLLAAATGEPRKFSPPVRDTTPNGSGDESKPAERRSREPPKKAKAATLPAKPVKDVQKAPERAGEAIQIGPVPTKPGSRLKKS